MQESLNSEIQYPGTASIEGKKISAFDDDDDEYSQYITVLQVSMISPLRLLIPFCVLTYQGRYIDLLSVFVPVSNTIQLQTASGGYDSEGRL